jgi:hypothetical protein
MLICRRRAGKASTPARVRRPFAGRLVLLDGGDERRLAREAYSTEHLVEELPRAPDTWAARPALLDSGRLSHEEHVGIRRTLAGDR